MGGGWSGEGEEEAGVIPRVIDALFSGIEARREEFQFDIKVSYIEASRKLLDYILYDVFHDGNVSCCLLGKCKQKLNMYNYIICISSVHHPVPPLTG